MQHKTHRSWMVLAFFATVAACSDDPSLDHSLDGFGVTVDDDFSTFRVPFASNISGDYAIGTRVRFTPSNLLASPGEVRLEITGSAFEWESRADGVVFATAAREGSAELRLYLDGRLQTSTSLRVASIAGVRGRPRTPALELFVATCSGCSEVPDDDVARFAVGAYGTLGLAYLDDAGDALAGRELAEGTFTGSVTGRDQFEVDATAPGHFELPVRVEGRPIGTVAYDVVEHVDALRIIESDAFCGAGARCFFVQAFDAEGRSVYGAPDWWVDGAPVERAAQYSFLRLLDGEGTRELRARLADAEVAIEVESQ